jgi:hypothetical protein
VWYEAKSGKTWEMLLSDTDKLKRFKEAMCQRKRIAFDNGAIYKLYTDTLIPESIKDWLTEKGISFTELI